MRVGAVKARGRLPRGAALGLASLASTSGWKRDPLTILTRTALMTFVEMVRASRLPEAAARSCLARGLAIAQKQHPWLHDAKGSVYEVRRLSPAVSGHVVSLGCCVAIGLEEVARQGPHMWGSSAPPIWQPLLDPTGHRSAVWGLHHQRALRSLVQNAHWQAAEEVEGLGYPFTELFARELFADVSELFQWPTRPLGDYFQCSTSRLEIRPYLSDYPNLRAAGWSVVVHDVSRKLLAEAWGAVPLSEGPEQLARDGEDYAVKVLTDAVASRPEAAASASCERVHLWAGRAGRLQDATVVKVKAHLGQSAVRNGQTTQLELDRADMRAKEGAAAARAPLADIQCLEGCRVIARQAA
ncbi:unnamed protein product, partial [Prorocentrum cordatum]